MPQVPSDDPTDPGAPNAYQARALEEGRALLGMRETEGENWGPVVRLVAAPFVSAERLATFAPGQKRQGLLLWCALTASYCWWKAWPGFKPLADSEVSGLWEKHSAQGLTWVKGSSVGDLTTLEGNAGDEVRERSYHMSEAQVFGFSRMPVVGPGGGDPTMADFIFFVHTGKRGEQKFKRDGKPDFRHVGLVQRFVP